MHGLILPRFAMLAGVAWFSLVLPVRADDAAAAAEEPEPAIPFVVVNVASVDNSLSDIAWMFNTAKRTDMMDVLGGLLGHVQNLQGIDRTRPFGQVIFIDTAALPPRPAVVFYLPVEDIETAVKCLSSAPVTVRKAVGRTDQFEILETDGPPEPVAIVRVIGKYAYAAPKEFSDMLDILPDLEPITQSLASRYDVAVTAQVKAIPEGVRQVFINFLRAQAEVDLQRRDEEDEAAYLVRRANGQSALDFVEQITLQGEDLTLGWNAEPEKHSGYFDFIVNATPDSEFAKYLTELGAKPSMFAALKAEDRPLTVNVSWVMNKREQTAATGLLQALKVSLSTHLPEMAQPDGPIDQMYNSLQATCDGGHFDLFVQFHAADVGEFVLMGGLKLAGAQSFGLGLERFLQGVIVKLQQEAVQEAPTIIPNAENHQGVSFHKITPDHVGDNDERLYGGVPDIYIGTSSRACWFSVGCNEALPSLRSAMDAVLTAPPAERSAGGSVPLAVTVRMAPWLEMPLPEAPDAAAEATDPEGYKWRKRRAENAADRREIMREAFTTDDAISVEGRPTESGFRTRIRLDEGFVKLLGLLIAREYDQSQL